MTIATARDEQDRVDCFYQRRSLILWVIGLLSALLVLVALGVFAGPGIEPGTWQVVWVPVACLVLLAVVAAFGWMLWKRPVALRISADGVDLPVVFKRPLPWSDIHRIRREGSRTMTYGQRDWLIVDPSPGVLAPLRLPVWRWLELKLQKFHGVRIPLHGLDAEADTIVASVERFREVRRDTG